MSCLMNMFAFISDFLSSWPKEIWAALIGAMVALIGVRLQNHYHLKALVVQLDKESDKAEKDRMLDLRKETYLGFVGEMFKASRYIGGLAQVNIANVNINDGLSDFMAVANQAVLVAQQDTSLLISELSYFFNNLTIDLAVELAPLSLATTMEAIAIEKSESNDKELIQAMDEVRRIENKQMGYSSSHAQAVQRYNFHQKLHAEIQIELEAAQTEVQKLRHDFNTRLMAKVSAMSDLQTRVLVAIRADLNISTDYDALSRQFELQGKAMNDKVGRLLDDLQSQN